MGKKCGGGRREREREREVEVSGEKIVKQTESNNRS